jgi:uncharacterized membrane-anchored protein
MHVSARLIPLALLFALLLPASVPAAEEPSAARSEYQQALSKLNWVRGPAKADLFGKASIQVPEGYVFLNPADTAKFMTLNQNLSGEREYLLAPDDLHWFGVFSFSDDGYVKDDEKIDASGILSSIKENTEEANKERRNKGWGQMHITGWKIPPYYDPETKRLEWAIDANDDNGSAVVNFNTRILGRGGVTSAVLVADPGTLDKAVVEFKQSIKAYDYNAGERYAEYKPGDKVAEYGLAALVGGGAAAVAVKTGLWKTIVAAAVAGWKVIVAAVVGAFAWISKRFKRQDS